MSERWWGYKYYEDAFEEATKEAMLLLSHAHCLNSRMKQFRMAVEQIGEMQSELDRLAALEQGVRELADRLDEPEHDLLSGADLRALLNPSTSHGTKENP